MNILVVNDDGWGAKGLMTLLPHILPLGKVTVVVPDGPRSGMSNAVTATRPVSLCKMDLPDSPFTDSPFTGVPGGTRFTDSPFTDSPIHRFTDSPIQIYTTDGTPSDCVKLAINVLFKGDAGQIDLVISGINHGSNASINLIYSGTMGACFVAAEHGIPAIGFSIDDMSENPDFSYMEPYLDQLLNSQLPDSPIHRLTDSPIILNINAPKGPIHGVQWTRQSRAHWAQEMQPVTLPDGETRYALAGFMVNDEPNANNTDLTAMENGYISIQPCKVDMTDYEAL